MKLNVYETVWKKKWQNRRCKLFDQRVFDILFKMRERKCNVAVEFHTAQNTIGRINIQERDVAQITSLACER